jgi:predicted MFS family arabinose efflux permease
MSFYASAYHEKSARRVGSALGFGNASSVLAGVPALALLSLFDWRAMLMGLAVMASWIAIGLGTALPRTQAKNNGMGFADSSKAFFQAFHQREVVLSFLAIAGVAGGFVAFFSFGAPVIAHVADLSRQEQSWLVSAMPLGFGLGMVLWSGGATHSARARAYALAPLGALAIWLSLANAAPKSGVILVLDFFLIGVFSANFPSVLDALDLFARSGARTSMKAAANSGVAVGSGVGQIFLGALPPDWIYFIGAGFCVMGLVAGLLLYARVMLHKRKLAKIAEELMGAGVRGVLSAVAVHPTEQLMSIDDVVITGVAWQSYKQTSIS